MWEVEFAKQVAQTAGIVIDLVGVAVIVFGSMVAGGRYGLALQRGLSGAYSQFRQDLGRAILLGLEFLVAADIIRTVAVEPTLSNVTVLGLIVLIRTFLSLMLTVEIEGRWPWQERAGPAERDAAVASRRI